MYPLKDNYIISVSYSSVRCSLLVCVEQSRPTFHRSFSSPRATVTSGNDRAPSFVGVSRNASLRDSSSRPAVSALCARQTSSASSSPSSTRRRDRDVYAGDRVGCLATAQVPVRRTSSLTSPSTVVKSAGGSVGRAATLPASRTSVLPSATHLNIKPVNRDHSPKTAGVQQRLKVAHRSVRASSTSNCRLLITGGSFYSDFGPFQGLKI